MRKWFVAVAAMMFLVGCQQKEEAVKPVDINPDVDVCEVCNMNISLTEYAAEIVMKDGTVYKFDDIGCMFPFMKTKEKDVAEAFVVDTTKKKWIKASAATYLYDKSFFTPMNNGVLVFAKKADAEAYKMREKKGTFMSYTAVKNYKWDGHVE